MKKTVLTAIMFLLVAGSAQAVPMFQVLDATFHIYGKVGYQGGDGNIEDSYDLTSDSPLDTIAEVVDPLGRTQLAKSTAEYGYLYSYLEDENSDSGASAITEVWTETSFKPLFNGSGTALSFFHTCVYPYGNNEFIITDNTLGTEIFNPGWDLVPDLRIVSFTYDAWDMDHTYTLTMSMWGSTNAVGWQAYEMGTDFYSYAAIPEPPTIFLFGFALIGLIGVSHCSVRRFH